VNIQTLPRKDKLVKRAFVPKLDYFLFADYDQIEMRILAYYMARLGDNSMKEVLANPLTDLHNESARGIFQLDREPYDPERQLGKNMNFSMVYGGGKPAVLRYLKAFNQEVRESGEGNPVPESWQYAGVVLDRFHERWPGIQRVVNGLDEAYSNRGYLRTIAGARLHPPTKHKMLNAVVQSGAAECMRSALRKCYVELRGMESHLVTVIHDELVFDVKLSEVDHLIEKAPGWMDCFPEVSEVVPITVSLEWSSSNWAEKEKVHARV
jgi:DNA polymerase-1